MKTCIDCGVELQPGQDGIVVDGVILFTKTRCGECMDKRYATIEAQDAVEDKRRRERSFSSECPALYADTDWTRLPAGPVKKVLRWKFGPRGLLITGDTAKGKTRSAFGLLRRLAVEEGRTFAAFTGNSFSLQVAEEFGRGTGPAWFRSVASRDVVLLDDLGKFKLTERVEAELFGLVENRVSWLRPLIVTTNLGEADLAGMVSSDRSEPLLRRLTEFCEVVEF